MIESFEIQNYRLFRQLKIEKLSRVNLITGKNNVGKTALLEALYLYATKAHSKAIQLTIYYREYCGFKIADYIDELFYNHNTSNIIDIGPTNNSKLTLQLVAYEDEWDKNKTKLHRQYYPYNTMNSSVTNNGIKIDYNKETTLFDTDTEFEISSTKEEFINNTQTTSYYINQQGLSINLLTKLWDNIALTDDEKLTVNILNSFYPGIEGIRATIRPENDKERYFIVKMNNIAKPISLSIMGDGIKKIFCIIIPMINTSNGIILIDEIENGIHYSIHQKLWEIILDFAEKLNVQVFATTHSWDCIDGFQRALNDFHDPSQGQLIRLSMRNDNIIATPFDARELAIATRENIEVR